MLFLSILMRTLLLTPMSSYTVPVDSVKIQFTFDKKEAVNADQTNYFYHVSIDNHADQSVYVVIPKKMETVPAIKGIMNSVNVDSHDDLTEYSLYSDPSFEIYKVAAHSTFMEQSCKIKVNNATVAKQSQMDLTIFIADEIKIGEIGLKDYVDHKDFYGGNIPYKIVGASTAHETLALK
jgi:hypothetical protein